MRRFCCRWAFCALGLRWFRSQPARFGRRDSLIGYAMLILSLPALLSAVADSRRARRDPAGRIAGHADGADGCTRRSIPWARTWWPLRAFLTALFLTTPFSFTGTHALVRGPLKKLDPIGRLKARWAAWREKRASRKECASAWKTNKTSGRQPVPTQAMRGARSQGRPPKRRKRAEEDEVARGDGERQTMRPVARRWFMPRNRRACRGGEEIRRANRRSRAARPSFRLPSPGLAAHGRAQRKDTGRRTEGVRARHRGEVPRIRRRRARHADQSRAGGHDLRVQARGGHQVQPHHRAWPTICAWRCGPNRF